MMGLEPTTFSMARRRSSQLSYIRKRAQYSRRPGDLACVQSLVDQRAGKLVVLPPDGRVAHAADLAGQAPRLRPELLERLVLDPVLAAHLLDHQLGVGDDLHLVEAELDRLLEAGDEGAVLRDVVRRD